MAPTTDTDAQEALAQTLEVAFEPAAETLGETWMTINDIERGLSDLVEQNASVLSEHAPAFQRQVQSELKRLDELVFQSVEVMDNLLNLVRQDLNQRSSRGLSASAFDAYLQLGGVHRGVQTETSRAAVVTPTRSPMAAQQKPMRLPAINVFDLLRRRNPHPNGLSKSEVKAEPAANGTVGSSKKRLRSRAPSDTLDGDSNKLGIIRMPKKVLKDYRPIAVHGVRERQSQREYQVEFEGLEEHVWLVSRRSPPAVRGMIQAYVQANRKKRRREEDEGVTPTSHMATNNVATPAAPGEDLDADDIYIVEKIVEHRYRHGRKEYFVKWDGYDTDENTWEPAAKLRKEVRSVVNDYERELAKAESRKATQPEPRPRGRPRGSKNVVKSKPLALGRPSNPSALTKTVDAQARSALLLQQSGKIPRVQFLVQQSDDEDSEDSDLLRLAASADGDDDDDSDVELEVAIVGGSGKQRRVSWLSPSIE